MSLSLPQALGLSVLSIAVWYIFRPYFVKSGLASVPGPSRTSWWKGNFHQVFNRQGWGFHDMLLKKYGSAVRLNMLFGDEQLYISDPLALHHILVKDQYTYEEPDMFITTNNLVFGPGLLSTLGERHRRQRKMLNPVFSIKHMRDLIPVFYPIAHKFRDIIAKQVCEGTEEINIMKWMSRAALEYIGQGGLGYSFNALEENAPHNKYSDAIKLFSPTNFKLFLERQFLPWIVNIGTPELRKRAIDLFPNPLVQTMRMITDVMEETSRKIFMEKKSGLERGDDSVVNQVGRGKDIMSILLKANMEASKEDRLPESELLGQMSTFIFAGHDTTTSAVCRILDQLSKNPDVQEKLRAEVRAARQAEGDLSYDRLMSLPYLDAVCRETLRIFPPVPQLVRTTRADVVLPLAWPITAVDGVTQLSEVPLKNNTGVVVSIIGANRCKKIWGEDAEEWKPERWLNPMPESVAKAHLPGVYASMMTFSGGGRACIGFKFAEMEMKLVLSVLLETFSFSPGSKEIFWAMSFLQSPVLKGETGLSPQLPLKISFAA
ncbi:cytochrome P450 [Pyrrhoderma noxium]|uniref:Cytochrome P450 n=1 Tax=Pyrrhoderma noxium TaxID=2282107 RepID=A0A286UL35_9AGAM|nr:cytochrome P450 [Pyrrhoderma noxium]